MFTRSTIRTGLFAGAVTLALAAPAGAAVVEWQAGPLGLAAGQVLQVATANPNIFACRVGVQVYAGPASRVLPGVTTAPLALVVDTYGNAVATGPTQRLGHCLHHPRRAADEHIWIHLRRHPCRGQHRGIDPPVKAFPAIRRPLARQRQ